MKKIRYWLIIASTMFFTVSCTDNAVEEENFSLPSESSSALSLSVKEEWSHRSDTTEWCKSNDGKCEFVRDYRDGQEYRSVKIGEQTWLAENMNYSEEDWDSFCYFLEDSNCEKFGRLYTWEYAQKACPHGFHLPSNEEFDTLVMYIYKNENLGEINGSSRLKVASYLKAIDGWQEYSEGEEEIVQLDSYGFSGLAAGEVSPSIMFAKMEQLAGWWTLNQVGTTQAIYKALFYKNNYFETDTTSMTAGHSIRCVKD